MGAVTFSLDPELLTVFASRVTFSTFVETGTFRGDSVAVVQGRVARIISIESDALLATEAMARFSSDPSVHIVHDSGAAAIRALSQSLADQDVLYWLDAHWCAMTEGPEPADSQCNLLDEIAAIGKISHRSVVLIDDARYLLSPPPSPHDPAQWPNLQAVLHALNLLSSTHEVAVVNDVIVYFPTSLAGLIREFATQHGVDWLAVAEKARDYDAALRDNVAKERVIQDLSRSLSSAAIPTFRSELSALSASRVLRPRAWGGAHALLSRPFALTQHEPKPPGLNALGNPLVLQQNADLPSIGIAMPSLNQARFIETSIRSVLSQKYPNLQFVIQDGGSVDDTMSVIDTFARHLHGVASEPDSGQADAINRAFARTNAEIMGWLNSDDVLMPGALTAIGAFFAKHPNVDVVYASRVVIDDSDLEVGRWVVPPNTHEFLDWADYIPQETLYWRRSLWERIGGQLDTSLAFAMDWDLLLRFADAGATFACLPQTIGAFRIHRQSKTVGSIESVGNAEMSEIRLKRHGRHVTTREINAALMPLYARAWQSRLSLGRSRTQWSESEEALGKGFS
jgi:hypothetical protein